MTPAYCTDILMVTYFRKAFTRQALEHLYDRTRTPFRLIVVDNGSTDGTVELLHRMLRPTDKVIPLSENVGLEAAKNVGMEHIESPRYVDTDNDILVPDYGTGPDDWLTRLHGLMDRNPQFAAIALRPQILVGVGPIFNTDAEAVENNVCGGSMRLMDTAAVREVGQWRDEFTNRSEEWHICTALRNKGWKVGYAKNLFCYHFFGNDNRWGYSKGVKHYHGREQTDFRDEGFKVDPKTLVPNFLHNE